jgi:hypothetical protein
MPESPSVMRVTIRTSRADIAGGRWPRCHAASIEGLNAFAAYHEPPAFCFSRLDRLEKMPGPLPSSHI